MLASFKIFIAQRIRHNRVIYSGVRLHIISCHHGDDAPSACFFFRFLQLRLPGQHGSSMDVLLMVLLMMRIIVFSFLHVLDFGSSWCDGLLYKHVLHSRCSTSSSHRG